MQIYFHFIYAPQLIYFGIFIKLCFPFASINSFWSRLVCSFALVEGKISDGPAVKISYSIWINIILIRQAASPTFPSSPYPVKHQPNTIEYSTVPLPPTYSHQSYTSVVITTLRTNIISSIPIEQTIVPVASISTITSIFQCIIVKKFPILYVQTKLENPLPSECIRVSEQGYHINGRASCIMTKILMQFKYSINHQSSCCNIRVEYLILVNL